MFKIKFLTMKIELKLLEMEKVEAREQGWEGYNG